MLAHIMVKRYWFLDLVLGKGPTQPNLGPIEMFFYLGYLKFY